MLSVLPDSAACGANIDIFDGFGNAGMGVPATPIQDYKTEYKPLRLDDISSSSGQDTPSHDGSTPFTSPPGMEMEYSGMGNMGAIGHGHEWSRFQHGRPTPSRQGSGTSYVGPMPHGMPEFHGLDMGDMGMENLVPDMNFR